MPDDQEIEFKRAQRELHDAMNALREIQGRPTVPYREPDSSGIHEPPYCSFCGKGAKEVQKLIAGPNVCICDECVALATEIMANA
jgi:hypothetical protein